MLFNSTEGSNSYIWVKNVVKNISKNLSGKCTQKFFDNAKQFATDALKRVQKAAEATGDLIGNKIDDVVA